MVSSRRSEIRVWRLFIYFLNGLPFQFYRRLINNTEGLLGSVSFRLKGGRYSYLRNEHEGQPRGFLYTIRTRKHKTCSNPSRDKYNFNNCVVLAIQLIVLVCFYYRTTTVLGCVVHNRAMFYKNAPSKTRLTDY